MTQPNDGSFDTPIEGPKPEKRIMTLLGLSQGMRPSKWCPEGHIIEWHNPDEQTWASYVVYVDDEGEWTLVCPIDGLGEAA